MDRGYNLMELENFVRDEVDIANLPLKTIQGASKPGNADPTSRETIPAYSKDALHSALVSLIVAHDLVCPGPSLLQVESIPSNTSSIASQPS